MRRGEDLVRYAPLSINHCWLSVCVHARVHTHAIVASFRWFTLTTVNIVWSRVPADKFARTHIHTHTVQFLCSLDLCM